MRAGTLDDPEIGEPDLTIWDAEIAAVVNYVTGRFGATGSELTQADIARRRQEN